MQEKHFSRCVDEDVERNATVQESFFCGDTPINRSFAGFLDDEEVYVTRIVICPLRARTEENNALGIKRLHDSLADLFDGFQHDAILL